MKRYKLDADLPIDSYSFSTLDHMLNAKVIDYYLLLIKERSKANGLKMHIFNCDYYNSIVYNQQFILSNDDIFDNDLLFLPININNEHWCFVIIDLISNEIRYYDSLPNVFDIYTDKHIKNVTIALANSLITKGTQFRLKRETTPTQVKSIDSGVFVCQFINCLATSSPIDFDGNDITYFRYIMGIEIIKGELLRS